MAAWGLTRLLDREGSALSIRGLVKNGRCEVSEFLGKCEAGDGKTYKKLAALLARISEQGLDPFMPHQVRRVRQNLYEIKMDTARLFCFRRGNTLLIATHGATKRAKKDQTGEINRAENIRNKYLASLS